MHVSGVCKHREHPPASLADSNVSGKAAHIVPQEPMNTVRWQAPMQLQLGGKPRTSTAWGYYYLHTVPSLGQQWPRRRPIPTVMHSTLEYTRVCLSFHSYNAMCPTDVYAEMFRALDGFEAHPMISVDQYQWLLKLYLLRVHAVFEIYSIPTWWLLTGVVW